MVPASLGCFLVIESRAHAEARGATRARPYRRDRLRPLPPCAGRGGRRTRPRQFEAMRAHIDPAASAVISGATGVAAPTARGARVPRRRCACRYAPAARRSGTRWSPPSRPIWRWPPSRSSRGRLFGPLERGGGADVRPARSVLVTGWGHWRGEGMARGGGSMSADCDTQGPPGRRRDRHGRAQLARRRARRTIGARSPAGSPASAGFPAFRPPACGRPSRERSISSRSRSPPPRRSPSAWPRMVIEEAIARSRASAARATSPARCSSPSRRSRWIGRNAARSPRRPGRTSTPPTPICCAPPRPAISPRYYRRFLFGSVAERLADTFGFKGSPIATVHRLRLRRDRDPARRRGDPAGRNRGRAVRRHRRFGHAGGADPLLPPLRALDAQRPAASGAARPFSKDRDGFVMAEGAGALVLESLDHARARGARILGVVEGFGEMADSFHRTRSSPDGKPIIGCDPQRAGGRRARAGRASTTSTRTAPARPRTTRWSGSASRPCSASARATIPISSNKSMIGHTLTAAGAIEAVFTLMTHAARTHPADDQLRHARPGAAASIACRTSRATRA